MSAIVELSHRTAIGDDIFDYKWFRHVSALERVGPNDPVVFIDSHSTCGPAGRQTFEAVALVFDRDSENPGIVFRNPITIGLAEKIVGYIKTRPWEE